MSNLENNRLTVANFWDARVITSANWWTNSIVVRNYNWRVCGKYLRGMSSGIHELLKTRITVPLELGISVGCGTGGKEMALLDTGAVRRFICYDLSATRIEQATAAAAARGLSDRISFHVADAFNAHQEPIFDLVYWNNSLHHMPQVRDAVFWSKSVLRQGGFISIDDFVGATRMQIDRESLSFVNMVRRNLPDKYLRNGGGHFNRELRLDWLMSRIEKDPSECADSGATFGALEEAFPNQALIPTGGLLYFLALNGMFNNFDMNDQFDRSYLELILLADHQFAQSNPHRSLYASGVFVK